MKIAFLTEMNFQGKIPGNHTNMRTEFSWIFALNADHYFIRNWQQISGYDYVMIIFPKGELFLNAVGGVITNGKNSWTDLLRINIVKELKKSNKNVCSIQEGPTWISNDLSLEDQINLYNSLLDCDILFAHNQYDTNWYKGLFPDKQVEIMPTLLIENLIKDVIPIPEPKVMIGGNCSRWYGGFQSYIISDEIPLEKYVQSSHSTRPGEDQILNVLPRMSWLDWMKTLSTFSYAVHMMPTVAAGTFSLNCAYFGIPCIGNKNVDTQRMCFPQLSLDAEDVYHARLAARKLWEDKTFYYDVSYLAKENYEKYFSKDKYMEKLQTILK